MESKGNREDTTKYLEKKSNDAKSHIVTLYLTYSDAVAPPHPWRWSLSRKLRPAVFITMAAFCSQFAASAFVSARSELVKELDLSHTQSTLCFSIFWIGFALGPMLWAPISEQFGRRPTVLVPLVGFSIFSVATGSATSFASIMCTRFMEGFIGCAPICLASAIFADVFKPKIRAVPSVLYAVFVLLGPTVGPLIGGAIVQRDMGWRWIEYIPAIATISVFLVGFFLLPETYPPVLLARAVKRAREEGGPSLSHISTKHEADGVRFRNHLKTHITRPMKLFRFSVVSLMSAYSSFVYGIIFLATSSFPIVFTNSRGWNRFQSALPLTGLWIGMVCGGIVNVFIGQPFYRRQLRKAAYEAIDGPNAAPEARLLPMMIGSIAFPIGLFLFGWTSSINFHWIIPCLGIFLLGFGYFTIYQAVFNYLIDTFGTRGIAASTVAACSFTRSLAAGIFPLFAGKMFEALGVNWASSVLGFAATAMIPIPFLFYRFGEIIRVRMEGSSLAGKLSVEC